jgi:hypothetical protein
MLLRLLLLSLPPPPSPVPAAAACTRGCCSTHTLPRTTMYMQSPTWPCVYAGCPSSSTTWPANTRASAQARGWCGRDAAGWCQSVCPLWQGSRRRTRTCTAAEVLQHGEGHAAEEGRAVLSKVGRQLLQLIARAVKWPAGDSGQQGAERVGAAAVGRERQLPTSGQLTSHAPHLFASTASAGCAACSGGTSMLLFQ